MPTLVLCRRGGPFVLPETAGRLASASSGATLELLDGEAHLYAAGDAAAIADRLNAFTEGIAGGGRSAHLSAREREVLGLVADGCSNSAVAERLVLNVRAVERHRLNIYSKLEVRGRAEAAARWRSSQT